MIKDFLETLCNFYIAALAAALPLYTRGTYVLLGDSKYVLFWNVSLFCLVMAGGLTAAEWILEKRNAIQREEGAAFSLTDGCMLCYGGCTAVSALCSSYGTLAWSGSPGWYMGAVSQILFVGIYFFVSRRYRGRRWPVYLWEAGVFLVVLAGFCNRLGLDPLGLMKDFRPDDWEYSHLISTIGNINWFCGYCAAALAMPVAGYLKAESAGKRLFLFTVSSSGLVILCIQGSDIGPVLAGACLGVCLLGSRRIPERFGRTLLLAAGVFFGVFGYGLAVRAFGENARKSLPADGPGAEALGWGGWWIMGLACLGLYFLLRGLLKAGRAGSRQGDVPTGGAGAVACGSLPGNSAKIVKGLWLGVVVSGAVLAAAAIWLYLVRLVHTEGWASGRGSLWRLAWQSFARGDLKQKLLGAGPDCFGAYVYSHFTPEELPIVEGHWADAAFVNAHNQFLNHLVNTGILGAGCAAALYCAALARYRCCLAGTLAIAMYGVNALVSFQQVLSTPLFFLMLGICEYSVRKQGKGRQYEVDQV